MLSRRTLLRGALAAAPFALLWRRTAHAATAYGPLIPDPEKILDLPAGFSYHILDRVGQDMSDGYRVPGNPDGMRCFTLPDGQWALLRNHELTFVDRGKSAYKSGQAEPAQRYRAGQFGAVTRIVVDPTTHQRVSSNLVLTGTARNCQGGPGPGGWLSAEEWTTGDHGFVFLTSMTASSVQQPQRIDGYGKMNHESAAIDASTGICYLTEDEGDSCFYRFLPDNPARPFEGQLQALKVVGRDKFDTSTNVRVGDRWQIEWVDIDNPVPGTFGASVRKQGRDKGAAIVSRGEGLWVGDGVVWFDATDGGPANQGQIFKLEPNGNGGTLTLMAQSTGDSILGKPDCITVAPWGELFMCEDGSGDQYIRVLHANGSLSTFAKNAKSQIETAGICFSPDHRVMFLNLFGDGITLAITGPFGGTDPDPLPDAGVDAGTPGPVDAGVDAGRVDAGRADAGPVDAGVPAPDAGTDPDPGGCSTGGGSPTALTAAAIVGAAALLRDRDPGN